MPASITTTPVSRSTSLRKKISDRLRDSPLIKEVLSPGGYKRRLADDDKPNSPYQIVPQQTPLAVELKETGIEAAKEAMNMAVSPQHGLGLDLTDAPADYSGDTFS